MPPTNQLQVQRAPDSVTSQAGPWLQPPSLQVNPGSWARFRHKAHINVNASCRGELYEEAGPHEDKCVRIGSGSSTVRYETTLCRARLACLPSLRSVCARPWARWGVLPAGCADRTRSSSSRCGTHSSGRRRSGNELAPPQRAPIGAMRCRYLSSLRRGFIYHTSVPGTYVLQLELEVLASIDCFWVGVFTLGHHRPQ